MWRRTLALRAACLLAAAAATLSAEPAGAALITYTSRASWESAVGSFAVNDLNAEATGTFPSRDFGDFTASRTDPGLTIGVRDAAAGTNVNGTTHLFLKSTSTQSPLTLAFDAPISAFGFDWRAIDASNDGFNFTVTGSGDVRVVSTGAPASGFFGVIETAGAFSSVGLQDDADGGGVNDGVGFDNISYRTGPALAVPEPGSLTLMGLGGVGMAYGALRRKRTAALAA